MTPALRGRASRAVYRSPGGVSRFRTTVIAFTKHDSSAGAAVMRTSAVNGETVNSATL